MFTISLYTERFRPDFTITLRGAPDWEEDIPGIYKNSHWTFRLPSPFYQDGFEFKFVLDQEYWSAGPNMRVSPYSGAAFNYQEGNITFQGYTDPDLNRPIRENGRVSRYYFSPNLNAQHLYDLIVVGSGIGGGIVAEQAADKGLDVLVLEAGSYLFPTHIGNLPRRHPLNGRIDKNIWNLWHDFKVLHYQNETNSKFEGGLGLNLGGRSIFWGGYIPRMQEFEFQDWPQDVAKYLLNGGYDEAEILLRRSALESDYQRVVQSNLTNRFSNLQISQLPLAVGQTDLQKQAVPTGVFSTADLLMESRLTGGTYGNYQLTINLNHVVNHLQQQSNNSWKVFTKDMNGLIERQYQGKKVVLAAGSIQSPSIAIKSKLQDPNNMIGKGLTDHAIFFSHFAIPPTSKYYNNVSAAKIIMSYKNATAVDHRYIVFVDLGSDFSLSRFVDPDIFAEHQRKKGEYMFGEVVFQFSSPLIDEHWVGPSDLPEKPSKVNIQDSPISDVEWIEIEQLTIDIQNELGAVNLPNMSMGLYRASLGGVAHEAGTLRMGPNGVVDSSLKFHGYNNLYACDLSIFPSSPAANPTLTLAALALRFANEL